MEKRISRWIEKGFIDNDTAKKLLLDYKEERLQNRKIKTNITIYTIASILIGLGVITFICANDWLLEILNRIYILKILVMMLLTFASLQGGYKLAYENKKFPKLGSTLIVLSSFLIGGTYALIGQIYNINANNAGLTFLWMISILPLAYLFKNAAINVISVILMILSAFYFYFDLPTETNTACNVLMPIMVGTMLYTIGNLPVVIEKYNNFSLTYKITGAILIFVILLFLTCHVDKSYQIFSEYYIMPVIFLIMLNLINYSGQKITELLKKETVFIEIILCFLLCAFLFNFFGELAVLFSHILIITLISFGFNYGYKFENSNIISTTNWMLTVYIAVNYCRWGLSFMDKSLFFMIGGIGLLSLGLFLENKKKQAIKKEK